MGLEAGAIELYRIPTEQGYQEVSQAGSSERIFPVAFPQLELAVGDIIG